MKSNPVIRKRKHAIKHAGVVDAEAFLAVVEVVFDSAVRLNATPIFVGVALVVKQAIP